MIEAPGWISSEVAGRSVVRSSRRVRIAGSGFGTCFRSFGFEFQGPCSAFTSWEVGREGEVARLKWSKFFGHIHDSTLIVGRSSIARASRSFQRLHWLKRASTEVTAMVQIRPRRTEQQQGIGRALVGGNGGGGAPQSGLLVTGSPKKNAPPKRGRMDVLEFLHGGGDPRPRQPFKSASPHFVPF